MGDTKQKWRAGVGYLIAGAALFFAWGQVGLGWDAFRQTVVSLEPTTVAVSLVLFGIHGAANSVAYGLLLTAVAERNLVHAGATAWGMSILAKYIPGGLWQVLGRGAHLTSMDVKAKHVVVSSIYEQAISLTACALIAATLAVFVYDRSGLVIIVVPLAGAGLFLLLSINRLRNATLQVSGRIRTYIASSAMYLTAIVPYLGAYLVLVDPDRYVWFSMDLLVGTIAGVLTVFAPGGMGIREAWISLQPSAMAGNILALLIVARVLIIFSELIIFGLTAWIRSISARSDSGGGSR